MVFSSVESAETEGEHKSVVKHSTHLQNTICNNTAQLKRRRKKERERGKEYLFSRFPIHFRIVHMATFEMYARGSESTTIH